PGGKVPQGAAVGVADGRVHGEGPRLDRGREGQLWPLRHAVRLQGPEHQRVQGHAAEPDGPLPGHEEEDQPEGHEHDRQRGEEGGFAQAHDEDGHPRQAQN
ncbi:hypothetical protein BN1723_019668, partial [Verticillium longisporum]